MYTDNLHEHTAHRNNSLLTAESSILVKSGADYFNRLLDIINRSQQELHLQTYIFIDDATGKDVIKALQAAITRGVKVKVLVDAFGSFALSREAVHEMKTSGILFRTFSPLFVNHRIRFGRRLHHKIVVADKHEALIGGINIEDKYHLRKNESTPWLDYAVYITGPIGQYISLICQQLWESRFYKKKRKKYINQHEKAGISIKIRHNDWVNRKEGISSSFRTAIKNSHESITIIGSYFLPGRRIRKLLKNAAARNVKIKIILQGASDVSMVKNATTWWYAWLFRNHIEIYEWTHTVLHGKLTLIDKHWASIGSYNINHLSDYTSIETNAEIHSKAFCNTVHQEMETVMSLSKRITLGEYRLMMNPYEQFICWLSFHTIRILFWVQFILMSKE